MHEQLSGPQKKPLAPSTSQNGLAAVRTIIGGRALLFTALLAYTVEKSFINSKTKRMSVYSPAIPEDYDGENIHHHENARRSRASRNSTSLHERLSRNSTGAKEEFITPRDEELAEEAGATGPKKDGRELMIAFISMVFVGLGNKVFNKLMTIPMYNYPNFLNLLTTFVCKYSSMIF
jgi:hypothetical protein